MVTPSKSRESPTGHCFQCLFLFPRYKLCLRYTAGNFNGSPSMRVVTKILRAPASEHLSNFCEQFGLKPNFASTFKLDETILYPYAFMRYPDPYNFHRLVFANAQHNVNLYINLRILEGQFWQQMTISEKNIVEPRVFNDRSEGKV